MDKPNTKKDDHNLVQALKALLKAADVKELLTTRQSYVEMVGYVDDILAERGVKVVV